MRKSSSHGIDQRVVRALGHPLRLRILRRLNEREASPSEIAEALDEPLGKVSYHIGVLRDNEAIELARTQPVRGALEHFYRPLIQPFFDQVDWDQLPASARQSLFGQVVKQIVDDVADAAAHGGLSESNAHASSMTLDLDEEGVTELAGAVAELRERAADIEARAAERRADSPASQRMELALLQFARPG